MSTSDFRSGFGLSAYWQYAEGSFVNICMTQGRSFINRLKTMLGLAMDGTWDNALQARIVAAVNQLNSSNPQWQTVLSAVQSDAANNATGAPVGRMSVHVGIWLAYYQANNRRFDAIQIPSDAILPQWGVPAADDRGFNGGSLLCYDPSVDRDPLIIDASERASATAHSSTGVRLEAGRSGPSSSVNVVNSGNGVSTGVVIAFAVGIAALGFFLARSEK